MSISDEDDLRPSDLEDSQDSFASSFQSSVNTASSNIPSLLSHERSFFAAVSPRLTTVANILTSSDKIQWINNEDMSNTNHMSKKNLKRKREKVGKYLMVQSACDPNVAKDIITDLWNNLLPETASTQQAIDSEIIEGLKTSVAELSGNGGSDSTPSVGGTRSLKDQKALLTISSAVRSGMTKQGMTFTKRHADRLGLGKRLQVSASKISKITKESGDSLTTTIETFAKRKTRKDCVRQYAHQYVDLYCHNDVNAHRIDSNEKKVCVTNDPVTGKPVYHPRRIWEGPVTRLQKYQDFIVSEEYKLFKKDHPSMDICERIFHENVCKCIRDTKEQSCVDQIISAVDEYLRAIKEAIRSSTLLRERLTSCTCEYHMSIRNNDIVGFEQIACKSSVRQLIEATCCAPVEDPNLSCGIGCKHVTPSFIPWKCVGEGENKEPQCSSCGVTKFLGGIEKCPVFSTSEDQNDLKSLFGCNVWEYCKIENCRQKQWELHKKYFSFSDIFKGFVKALEEARIHFVNYQWSGHALKRIMEGINPKKACAIFTDFSAAVNLEAIKKDNSNVPVHAVLDIFLVYDGHRHSRMKTEDSDGVHERDELLVHCAAHHFLGNTKTKGKTHNYAYHTECLLHLIRQKESERKPDENGEYSEFVYYIVTDNCPGQYKCRQNLFFVASICDKEFPGRNIRLEHVFAQKYRFKGNWDGEGKVSKACLKRLELQNIRSPNALSATLNLKKTIEKRMSLDEVQAMISNGDLTKSAVLKTIMTSFINERTIYYVTSSEREYEQLCFGRVIDSKYLVYVERDMYKRGDFHRVNGSNSMFHFRSIPNSTAKKDDKGNEFYPILSSTKVCACNTCLDGKSHECQYLRKHGGIKLHHVKTKPVEVKIATKDVETSIPS